MKRTTKAELEERNAQLNEENRALIAFQKARAFPLDPLEKVTVLKAEGAVIDAETHRWEADVHVLKPHRGDGGYVMILEHSVEKDGLRRLQHVSAMSGSRVPSRATREVPSPRAQSPPLRSSRCSACPR